MKGLSLFDVVSTFVTEAIVLIGWLRLGLALSTLVLVGAVVLWGVSRVLCREESRIGAILSSIISLVFVGGVVGLIHLSAALGGLASNGEAVASSFVLQAGLGIAAILVFVVVQGAFATDWWKAIVLTLVLLGSTGAVGLGAMPRVFGEQKPQLVLLAGQCAGTTSDGPWLVKSEAANGRIKIRRARRERDEIKAQLRALFPVYEELEVMRQSLRPNDHVRLLAYNQRAADYTKQTQALQADLARAEALVGKGDSEEE